MSAHDDTPLPLLLRTPAFLAAWADWRRYRRERRLTLTPMTMTRQTAFLESLGPVLAVASIEQSILQGWQGLFQPHRQEVYAPKGAASPVELMIRHKELERVEKAIDNLRVDGLSELNQTDRQRLKLLKARREELKVILGLVV